MQSDSTSGDFADAEIIHEFPEKPKLNAPVIMTDDRMKLWDRRDITPEFLVNANNRIVFNTPKNEILNPDFEASSDLDFWMITASPATATENANFHIFEGTIRKSVCPDGRIRPHSADSPCL